MASGAVLDGEVFLCQRLHDGVRLVVFVLDGLKVGDGQGVVLREEGAHGAVEGRLRLRRVGHQHVEVGVGLHDERVGGSVVGDERAVAGSERLVEHVACCNPCSGLAVGAACGVALRVEAAGIGAECARGVEALVGILQERGNVLVLCVALLLVEVVGRLVVVEGRERGVEHGLLVHRAAVGGLVALVVELREGHLSGCEVELGVILCVGVLAGAFYGCIRAGEVGLIGCLAQLFGLLEVIVERLEQLLGCLGRSLGIGLGVLSVAVDAT